MKESIPVQTIHNQWQIHVYMVSEDSYDALDIEGCVYPNWIISHVKEGQVKTGMKGREYLVKPGGVMMHPPYLPFYERSELRGTHQWISLDFASTHNLDFFNLFPVSPVVQLRNPSAFSIVFNSLLSRWQAKNAFRELGVTADILHLVTLIMEEWERGGQPIRSSEFMTSRDRFFPLIQYMSEHLHQKVTREQLADQVHLNTNYFDKAFNKIYGINPIQMLRDMRLNKAKKMLETTKDSLASIAIACGLGDAAYLSRLFTKSLSMTPGKYRDYMASARTNYMNGELQ